MWERFPVPFEEKALSGRILAFGATRWTSPEVIVPWPNATYGEPSRIAAEDWSSIAALDCCTITGCALCEVVVLMPVEERSSHSEAPDGLRVKSNPVRRTGLKTGWRES